MEVAGAIRRLLIAQGRPAETPFYQMALGYRTWIRRSDVTNGASLFAIAFATIMRSPGSRVHFTPKAALMTVAIGNWQTDTPICWLRSERIWDAARFRSAPWLAASIEQRCRNTEKWQRWYQEI